MKRIFNLLLLLSFAFLFAYLLKQDIIIPEVPRPLWLIPSFIFLFAGFYASTQSWRIALRTHGIRIRHALSVSSHGLSVFAKYIPGKIWVILGRASYISASKSDIKNNSFISMKEQMVYTWLGFLIASIPTVIYYQISWFSGAMLLLVVLLSLFLFVKKIHDIAIVLLRKLLKIQIDIPFLNFKKSLPLIAGTALIWIAWTLAFYFFIMAFTSEISAVYAFAFPLSVCFGLIAIIFPGGIGVREGIIVGYLVLAGMDKEIATSIAFFNRLAFIIGEVFIFLLGLYFKFRENRTAD